MSRTKAILARWHGPHKPSPAKARALRRETIEPAAWAPFCVGCGKPTPLLHKQDDGSDVRRCNSCEGNHE